VACAERLPVVVLFAAACFAAAGFEARLRLLLRSAVEGALFAPDVPAPFAVRVLWRVGVREPTAFAAASRTPWPSMRGSFFAAPFSCRCSAPIIRPSDSADRIRTESASRTPFRGFRNGSVLSRLAIPGSSCGPLPSDAERQQGAGQLFSPEDRKIL
jgi:hypothetical protein